MAQALAVSFTYNGSFSSTVGSTAVPVPTASGGTINLGTVLNAVGGSGATFSTAMSSALSSYVQSPTASNLGYNDSSNVPVPTFITAPPPPSDAPQLTPPTPPSSLPTTRPTQAGPPPPPARTIASPSPSPSPSASPTASPSPSPSPSASPTASPSPSPSPSASPAASPSPSPSPSASPAASPSPSPSPSASPASDAYPNAKVILDDTNGAEITEHAALMSSPTTFDVATYDSNSGMNRAPTDLTFASSDATIAHFAYANQLNSGSPAGQVVLVTSKQGNVDLTATSSTTGASSVLHLTVLHAGSNYTGLAAAASISFEGTSVHGGSQSTTFYQSGKPQPIYFQVNYADGGVEYQPYNLSFSSSDASVATVSYDALNNNEIALRAIAPGSATITVSLGSITFDWPITVVAHKAQNLIIDSDNSTLGHGLYKKLRAIAIYDDGSQADITSQVTWSRDSSSSSCATIGNGDANGAKGLLTVIASSSCSAVITATDSYSGLSFSEIENVNGFLQLTSFTVSPSNPTLVPTMKFALHASGTLYQTINSYGDVSDSVQWSATPSSVLTVDANTGIATAVSAGTATVTGTIQISGGGTLTATATYTISSASLTYLQTTPTALNVKKDFTKPAQASAIFRDSSVQDMTPIVTWSSSNPAIATVDSNGNVHGVSVGSTNLVASLQVGGVTRTANLPVTVSEPQLSSIQVTPNAQSIAAGNKAVYQATGVYSDGSTEDLTSSCNWQVLDVNGSASNTHAYPAASNGTIVGASATTDALNVQAQLGSIKGTASITVNSATLTGLSIIQQDQSSSVGWPVWYWAMAQYSDGSWSNVTNEVSWASSDTSIATISNATGSAGTATGTGAGIATITASLGGQTASSILTEKTIVPTLASVQITPPFTTLVGVGSTQSFTALAFFTDGTSITQVDVTTAGVWTSSDPTKFSISNAAGSHGLATTLAATDSGTVTFSYKGQTAQAEFTATTPTLSRIEVAPNGQSIVAGETLQMYAIGYYSNGSTQDLTTQVTWASAYPGVATVNNSSTNPGLATGVAQGIATITAQLGSTTSLAAYVSVKSVTVSGVTPAAATSSAAAPSGYIAPAAVTLSSIAVQVDSAAVRLPVGVKTNLKAIATYSDNSTQDITSKVTWSTSDDTKMTISNVPGSQGVATGVAASGTFVQAIATLGSVTGQANMVVTAAALTGLSTDTPNITVAAGASVPVHIIGTFSDGSTSDVSAAVTYGQSSSPSVAQVWLGHGAGAVYGYASGTATAMVYGSNNIKLLLNITVTDATLASISISPNDLTNYGIVAGNTRQMYAAATYSDGTIQDVTNKVTWSSSNRSIMKVANNAGQNGLLQTLAAGTASVGASLDGVTTSVPVLVTSATLTSLQIVPDQLNLTLGMTGQVSAMGTYSDNSVQDLTKQVAWSIDNGSITVSNKPANAGLVTAVASGTAHITAVLPGGVTSANTTTVSTSAPVLNSINVTCSSSSVPAGSAVLCSASGSYNDNKTRDLTTSVSWSTSSANTAAFKLTGVVGQLYALSAGNATVYARYAGVEGLTSFTVTSAVLQSISIGWPSAGLAKGQSGNFTATGHYSDSSTQDLTSQVTWTSSDPTTATVSNAAGQNGRVTALAPTLVYNGVRQEVDFDLTARLGAISHTETFAIANVQPVSAAITAPSTLAQGALADIQTVYTMTDGTTEPVDALSTLYRSSNQSVIAIVPVKKSELIFTRDPNCDAPRLDQCGQISSWKPVIVGYQVVAVGTGTATVTFTLGALTAQKTITVTAAALSSINIATQSAAAPLVYSTYYASKNHTLQLLVSGTKTDGTAQSISSGVTWSSSDTSVATVDQNGLVTAVATASDGPVTITASYNSLTTTFVVYVNGLLNTPTVFTGFQMTANYPSMCRQQLAATLNFRFHAAIDVTQLATWALSRTDLGISLPDKGLVQSNYDYLVTGSGAPAVTATYLGMTYTWPNITVTIITHTSTHEDLCVSN